jgi:hypothetical protein
MADKVHLANVILRLVNVGLRFPASHPLKRVVISLFDNRRILNRLTDAGNKLTSG